MKKRILSVTALTALSTSVFAQGIALEDNSAFASANGYDTTINGVINKNDLNLTLLIGSGTPNNAVITLLLSDDVVTLSSAFGQTSSAAGDISAAGYIYDPSTLAYSLAAYASTTQDFEIEAWTGNYSSYAAAEASGLPGVYAGVSQVWSAAIPASPTGFPLDVSNMGIINLTQIQPTVVPEPSVLALASVGFASMLIFRRRK